MTRLLGYIVTLCMLLLYSSNARADIVLSTSTNTYSQDFNTLATSSNSSVIPANWALSEVGNNANSTYGTGSGNSNSGNTYSYGAGSSTERAFGALASGSVQSTIGAVFANGDASSDLESVDISYRGEMWRSGSANKVETLAFEYSTDATSLVTGTWNVFSALNYTNAPVNSSGSQDGNSASNQTAVAGSIAFSSALSNGQSFWIRWFDVNDSGFDNGLAIDDFSITGNFAPVPEPTSLILFGSTLFGISFRRRRRRTVQSAN